MGVVFERAGRSKLQVHLLWLSTDRTLSEEPKSSLCKSGSCTRLSTLYFELYTLKWFCSDTSGQVITPGLATKFEISLFRVQCCGRISLERTNSCDPNLVVSFTSFVIISLVSWFKLHFLNVPSFRAQFQLFFPGASGIVL